MITKHVPGACELRIYLNENRVWILEEDVDEQSYDEYEEALRDFEKVVDSKTLTEVFGWSENPYER